MVLSLRLQVPIPLPVLVRIAVIGALCAHAFFVYTTARCLARTFGFDLGVMLMGVVVTLVMMVPFVWVYWIVDLPDIWQRHLRPMRRWRANRCPACGYSRKGVASVICPECGVTWVEPTPYRVGWPTVRRFVLIVLIALTFGTAAGEMRILLDERAFLREAEASPDGVAARARGWPNGAHWLFHDAIHGPTAGDRSADSTITVIPLPYQNAPDPSENRPHIPSGDQDR